MKFMNLNALAISREYREKFDRLTAELKGYKRIALAFSGGVDSTFVLAAAIAGGVDTILAVTLISCFFTRREKQRVLSLVRQMGVDHLCLESDILNCEDVVRNDEKRCYFCKQQGFSMIRDAARERGIHTLVHGINLDDLGDYRPGIEAAKELGFKAPLVEAGFSKQEIRECSRQMGLDTWHIPSQSCLATRIPVGEPITLEKLERIEQAEAFLHELGLTQVRVRCHGSMARIETLFDEVDMLMAPNAREKVSGALKEIGFDFVALDLDGYRTGKMNLKNGPG